MSWSPAFAHRRLVVNDVDLHYLVGGSGQTVLLVHGFPQHSWLWRPIANALTNEFKVIVPDLRGMGGSSIPPTGYDAQTVSTDLTAILDAEHSDHVHLVGYDIGGACTTYLAYVQPERVRTLTLVEYAPPGYGFEYGFQPTPNWQSWQLSFFTQPDVAVRFLQGQERELLSWYFWHWAANPHAVTQADFELYVRELQKPGGLRGGFEHFAAVFENQPLFQAIPPHGIPVPSLGVGGEYGTQAFPANALNQLTTGAEQVVIPGAGHWIVEEQPEALLAALTDFWRKLSQ
ncbi:MAG: alpha/beta hydrolase [Fimbriimonadaceae bacterium]|nr:alpha/beta hydrolase [Fimbriimonadaceae bacterium]